MARSTVLELASASTKQLPRQRLKIKGLRGQKVKLPTIVKADEAETDLFSLTSTHKLSLKILPVTTAAFILASYYYWWLQYTFIRGVDQEGFGGNNDVVWRKRFLVLEILCAVPYQLKALVDSLAIFTGEWRPKLRLLGDEVPPVDVAIVCCKEELDVILDTVRAALNTDYPSTKFRLIVSDDGAQREVEAGVRQLQKQYPHRQLFYTARQKTRASSHKAGNLNHVYRFVATLSGGPAPFLASLDADMICERHWLRAQLPHLVLDPKMAFTCPPPRFYNVPVDDPLSQSLLVFQRVDEIAKDRAGFPWCTGSGWVMKRAALAEVGGFPELSVTEDLLLGNLILGRGWRAAYVFETLQWGLVPDSFHGHIEQRKRWNTGAVQAGMIMKFCLFGDKAKHLDLRQRLFGFTCPFSSSLATVGLLQAVQNLAFFAGGWSNAVYADTGELKQLVRVAAFMWIVNFLRRCNTAVICGYAIAFRDNYCTEFLGCYWALDHWKTFILPRWLGGKEKAFSARFVATGSIVDPLNERDEKLRAPWQRRVHSVLFQDGAIFPVLLGCGFVLALCLNIRRAYGVYLGADSSEFWTFLLTRLFWMPPAWPSNIVHYFRPLQYALFPPSMPDREALLVRDENNVAYPTSEAKKTRTTWNGLGAEIVPTVLTAYAVGVLISTWWW